MIRTVFKSKIHRAVVTHANRAYEGSVTIDAALLRAADIVPFEQVHVWNVTRGTRLQTYAIEGPEGSGALCLNGAAAHGNEPGDVVIVATFVQLGARELARHVPKVVRVDRRNRIVGEQPEVPGPRMPARVAAAVPRGARRPAVTGILS
jgi:aspartate 1-decarboxylase